MGKDVAESQADIPFTIYNPNPDWELAFSPGWTSTPNYTWQAGRLLYDWGGHLNLDSPIFDYPIGTFVKLEVLVTAWLNVTYQIRIAGGPVGSNIQGTGLKTISGFLTSVGGQVKIYGVFNGIGPYIEFEYARAWFKPYDEVLATRLGFDLNFVPEPALKQETWSYGNNLYISRLASRNGGTNIMFRYIQHQ